MYFPVIYRTKPEMKQMAEEQGYLDLLEATWFCHNSSSKPCGICTPCQQYVRDGFANKVLAHSS
jgi:7-cyano-7-deazaguanine synthase